MRFESGREQVAADDPLTIAASAARGFPLFKCEECADNIRRALEAAGHSGKIIELRGAGERDHIVCGSYREWTATITENGRHVGVRVGDMAFDNLHPDGMRYDEWLKDFDSHGGMVVASVTEF